MSELGALPAEYTKAAETWLSEAVDALSRELHPILTTIQSERVADLPTADEHSLPAAEFTSPLFRGIEVIHEISIGLPETLMGDVDPFLSIAYEMADAFGTQMTQGILAHISEVCVDAGNTIQAGDRGLVEGLIEALETIHMTFDDDGNPNLTFVAHPSVGQQLRENPPTAEQERRIHEILSRRREEYLASRRRQELP